MFGNRDPKVNSQAPRYEANWSTNELPYVNGSWATHLLLAAASPSFPVPKVRARDLQGYRGKRRRQVIRCDIL